MENEYISISEFARRAGVSNAYVYKALSTRLSAYYKVVDNKKVLNIKALELFVDNKEKTNNQSVDMLVEALMKQLEVKDKQIEELTKSLQFEQKKHQDLQDKYLLLEQKEEQIKEKVELVEVPIQKGSSVFDELSEEDRKKAEEESRELWTPIRRFMAKLVKEQKEQ